MPEIIGCRHVGWGSKDPVALAEFYENTLGMKVVHDIPAESPIGRTIFLSHQLHDEDDHDIVIFNDDALAHTAFKTSSLAELKEWHRHLKEKGVQIAVVLNHGVSLSLYLQDPEGRRIEIFWLTHVEVTNPNFWAQPIDLDRPDEELLAEVRRVATSTESVEPPTDWQQWVRR